MGTTDNAPARLLSMSETAVILGVSKQYVAILARRDDLPVVALGRRKLVAPDDLRDFIAARRSHRKGAQ